MLIILREKVINRSLLNHFNIPNMTMIALRSQVIGDHISYAISVSRPSYSHVETTYALTMIIFVVEFGMKHRNGFNFV